jgi:hypothetical protein
MSAHLRVAGALLVPALVIGLSAAASAAPSASIEQVRNGPPDASETPTPAWANGNAGASNSHYLESHSIAYRTIMDDLPTDGTVVELIIGYDVKSGGNYAIDYLTHFQRLLPHVLFGHSNPEVFDPLSGVTGVSSTVTTAPIPVVTQSILVDPDGADPEPAALQPGTSMAGLLANERLMTLYGGALLDVSYVSEGSVALATRSSQTQVRVRFRADSPKAVLAWGGHIASRWDWGFDADGSPRSAGGISGSSYHMRLETWNLGNLGNQDRSMSTDAVYPVPRCMISNPGPFCAGSTNAHAAPAGMESYTWSLFDNTAGAYIVGANTGLSIVVHAPFAGSYSVQLTTTASGFVKQCETTVLVTAPLTVNAGADLVVCASSPQAPLSGSASGGSTVLWSGGSGSFSPSAGTLNAIYTPSAAEIAAGGVTLTLTGTPSLGPCPPVSDQVRITINALPTANAGPDQTRCATSPLVQLAGQVGGVGGGTWSGGAGTFSPSASALNATYQPTSGEIAAGSVQLTLTTQDPAGPCGPVGDTVRITFAPAATANAGPDQIVCASTAEVQLAGSIGGSASSAAWSGGAGRFRPNASALDARYTPTAGEIAAGQVTLVLTTDDVAGPCPPVSDQVRITIDPLTVANAGPDQTVCATSPQAQLGGSVSGAVSGGVWTGGAGNFSPSRSALNAIYTATAAEIAAGSVTLVLTSAPSARPCPPDDDAMTIFIAPAATVSAGPDRITCAASPQVQLAGSVGGSASGGTWSGGGGSFSPSPSALNAIYTPSPSEVASGSVVLTLTTNDPSGPCPAVSDQMRITYEQPQVSVPNRIVCEGISSTRLCASPSHGVAPYTYQWSNGATTQCITVSQPGSYQVTITDAIGCRATGSGSFGHRDCEGQLTHTSVTCDTYMGGTGDDFSTGEMNVQWQNNIMTGIAPGVFFYYSFFTAPSSSFTLQVVQEKSRLEWPFIPQHQDQGVLYDADCNQVGEGTETSPGRITFAVTGATPGQGFIVRVKYNLKALIGVYMAPGTGCRYDFKTVIDGQVVDRDPDGLQFGGQAVTGIGDDPPVDLSEDMLFRPMPNPFHSGMRMAYAVPAGGAEVNIRVYDVAGRVVRTLVSGARAAGLHMAEWDGRDDRGETVGKGIYFVDGRVGGQIRQARVTFLR